MDINMMMSQLAPGLNVPPEIARGFLQMLEDQAPPQEFKKGNKTTIGDLCLKEGDQFHLEFDMITEWWHTLTVQKIDERSKEKKVMRLVKSKGEAPPQYDGAIGDTENGVAGLMAVVDWSGPRPKARWVMPPENIMNDYIDAEDLHNRRALQKPKAKNKKSG